MTGDFLGCFAGGCLSVGGVGGLTASCITCTKTALYDHRRVSVLVFRELLLGHDPEKHALGPRPDGWVPVFPRDKREAFARRSCSNKKIKRDDDSKKSHPALGRIEICQRSRSQKFRAKRY
jgi:hypothetical protein